MMTGLLPFDFECLADRGRGHAVLFAYEQKRGNATSGNATADGEFRAESDVPKSFEIERKDPAGSPANEAR